MVIYSKRIFLLCIVLYSFCIVQSHDTKCSPQKKFASKQNNWLSVPRLPGSYRRPFSEQTPNKFRMTHALGAFAYDVFWVNVGLISWDTFKIFVTTVPFYAAARMTDDKLHNCFFDHKRKKNKNEPAQWCKEVARLSIGLPIAYFGAQAFLSKDEDMRKTSQIFLIGMPFVLLAKDVVKKLDFDVCKRPFHEKFAKEQRSFGGFPSGHLAEASYMAVLYGMRYGPAYAIPLGTIALFVTCVFLSSNRHYLSQMIAGAGFGAMYAFSANRLIDSRLAKSRELRLGLSVNDYGGPTMSLAFSF
jgi:hypothetical protein